MNLVPFRLNLYSFVAKFGGMILSSFDKICDVFYPNQAVYNISSIQEIKQLENHHSTIFEEYKNINLSNSFQNVKDFYVVETDIGQDENWKGFPLIIFNYKFDKNVAQCPATYSIISKLPGCTSAMFSVLHPGKHILPHKGLYKGVLRCLFTLQAPENGRSWIKVNGHKYPFETGKCILFDETFEHEVLNDSDRMRIVLYLDIYRKLPFPLDLLNKLIFTLLKTSPFIQNILTSYQQISPSTFSEHFPVKPTLK